MKVLTVGSATIDTVAVIANDRIEQIRMSNAATSFLLLEEGRKTDALEISTHCGGGAINTAVCFARLGHRVSTIVKLGADTRADAVLDRLALEGVSQQFVMRSRDQPTGASVLVSSHDRNAAIFAYRGANAWLSPIDIDRAAFSVELVYISSLSNQSADCFPLLVDLARDAGAMIATNPGIRQLSAKGGDVLERISTIDLLVVNRVEAEALVSPMVARHGHRWTERQVHAPYRELPGQARRPLSGGGYQVGVPALLATLAELGPRYVTTTLGQDGALMQSNGRQYYCPSLAQQRPAGSAGAGDAFSATLAADLADGAECEAALRAAAVNSSSVVGFADAQSGLLDKASLERKRSECEAGLPVISWEVGT